MIPFLQSAARYFAGTAALCSLLAAQGAYRPLTVQGLDQRIQHDVRTSSMGGTATAAGSSAAVLFSNPAGLTKVSTFEIRVSGDAGTLLNKQTQKWVPNRYFTGLSLMMEDMWGDIKTPMLNDTTPVTDPWEQLQKPFDKIGPNWSRTTNSNHPLSAAAALPLTFDDITIVVGLGGAQLTDLDHYFQNNNVTDPLLGQYRPYPIGELQPGDTLRARWYQSIRKREGSIWGITPAVGVSYAGISVGASATYYTGSSDDIEQRYDRGFLTFIYNRFKLQDTVRFTSTRTGTSEYSGMGFTLGLRIEQPTFTVGASLQLPYTLTRKYSGSFSSREEVVLVSKKFNPSRTADSVRTTAVQTKYSGTDDINFPYGYSLGVMLKPFNNWTFAFELESRNLNDTEVKSGSAPATKPWLASPSYGLGAEYRWMPWLALRTGYRENAQVFASEGAAIIGEPVMMSAYSAGAGVEMMGIVLDVAYEYSVLRYQDIWQSNVNTNGNYRHKIIAEIGYRL
jgi:opacity protein-like surface antigen